jgi:hypothetical protein
MKPKNVNSHSIKSNNSILLEDLKIEIINLANSCSSS